MDDGLSLSFLPFLFVLYSGSLFQPILYYFSWNPQIGSTSLPFQFSHKVFLSANSAHVHVYVNPDASR